MANSSISVVWETTSTCSPETQIAATMNVKVGACKIGPAERIFENHLQRWAMQHHLDPLEEPPLLQASHPHSQKWIKMADANMLVLWFLNSLCDWKNMKKQGTFRITPQNHPMVQHRCVSRLAKTYLPAKGSDLSEEEAIRPVHHEGMGWPSTLNHGMAPWKRSR